MWYGQQVVSHENFGENVLNLPLMFDLIFPVKYSGLPDQYSDFKGDLVSLHLLMKDQRKFFQQLP